MNKQTNTTGSRQSKTGSLWALSLLAGSTLSAETPTVIVYRGPYEQAFYESDASAWVIIGMAGIFALVAIFYAGDAIVGAIRNRKRRRWPNAQSETGSKKSLDKHG